MNSKVAAYIEQNLTTIAILEQADVAYENVEILAFKTSHDNGQAFANQRGELYAIAVLNAVTGDSAQKINRELKKNKNLTIPKLKALLEKHYLKCLITEKSDAYSSLKKGDKGIASFTYDDVKSTITPSFSTETN